MMNLSESPCFSLQNGVVNPLCCNVIAPNGNIHSLKSKKDSELGNVNGEPLSRPTRLEVNKSSKSNVIEDRLPERSSNDEDSEDSLPSTPEMALECSPITDCPSGDEVMEDDTRQLIATFLRDYTGLSHPRWKTDKQPLVTMKRVVEDVIAKHRYAYNGMISKLGLDDVGDDMSVISSVAKSLFSDGTTNWGRIASLVAFGAVVSQHLKESGRGHCVDFVGREISTYLLTEQRTWLVKNKAWNGFVEFFHVQDPESVVRNTLMAFAGFAGIGATLALLIRFAGGKDNGTGYGRVQEQQGVNLSFLLSKSAIIIAMRKREPITERGGSSKTMMTSMCHTEAVCLSMDECKVARHVSHGVVKDQPVVVDEVYLTYK